MMPVEYVRKRLDKICDELGSQKKFADKHGVSTAYVNDVLLGRRDPGKKVLRALGMKKVTGYVYVALFASILLATGVVEAKQVVLEYDDFIKIVASKEQSDKLKNKALAENAVLVKLKDEQTTIIDVQAKQIKACEEILQTQERLGATEEEISKAVQTELMKAKVERATERRLSRYKSEAFWLGVVGVVLWVVN